VVNGLKSAKERGDEAKRLLQTTHLPRLSAG
jgi:hypothetical protein